LSDTLEVMRERLRTELRESDLAEGLDTRYRIVTAHMTAVRFRAPIQKPKEFFDSVAAQRMKSFGVAKIRELGLVRNDWYMSSETREVLSEFRL
jgi:2'-5' RNA ligase